MVWTTLSVKNTALARRNGSSFDRPAEISRGRMCGKKHRPSRSKTSPPHMLSCGGYDYLEQKLMDEKTKKKLEEVAQSGSTEGVINPPSLIRRHVKCKMTRTKKTGQLTSVAAKEIAKKIMQSQLQSQIQSQGLALPLEPKVGPSATRVSTKGSCVDPSPIDQETGDSDKYGLYIEENHSRLVALGRVYEGSTAVHNIPLLHGQVKVGVDEVKDAEASVPVPTDEVVVSPAKPPNRPDPEVDDPLYLMTLTIPQLFLNLQVMWDATMFGVFNPDFPLYIKHEDLSEIAHDGQCLSISVIQLWILHLTETSMRVGNSDVYGFLEPQSIQRFGQLHRHWQMVVILPKENLVWFCSLHNRPDNYLKGIIDSALKGLDDTPQPKSKAGARWIVVKCNRQKGSTECGYYVMHWMSTIILGTFRNNWETYFNDVRPLEAERLKALRIQ
ncbi:hypothetical protein HKD37_16G045680 [Glycine soja]